MARLALSCGLLSSWLALLLLGWSFGGAVHLLLAAALVLFPWRELSGGGEEPGEAGGEGPAGGRRERGESAPPG